MVILNFLAAPRAARTGRARDLGEQENWGEAFQKTDTYPNLALVRFFSVVLFYKMKQNETCKASSYTTLNSTGLADDVSDWVKNR